jgi:GT2 family glycosyltransferase
VKPLDLAIVFGTYNRRAMLEQAVETLRAGVGDLRHYFMIVDGGSTDGTIEWLDAQPDVVRIQQRGPLTGAVRAFNLGFSLAVTSGAPFVAHFNDDAELETARGLEIAVERLRADPRAGAVAFAFDLGTPGDYHFDHVNGRPYSNFGVIRREAGMAAAVAQGDPDGRRWWNPIYRTYGADSELGVWLWKLGWRVVAASDIRVHDCEAQDELRVRNEAANPDREDSRLFWDRWRDETYAGALPL